MKHQRTTNKPDTTKLFIEYLNTCNAALDQHKNEFPYMQLIELGQDVLGNKKMGVAVYKEDPKRPHDFFTVEMAEGALHFVKHGKKEPDVVWKASEDYLKRVVDNRDEYIDKPSKLDLDWLKSRVGIDAS